MVEYLEKKQIPAFEFTDSLLLPCLESHFHKVFVSYGDFRLNIQFRASLQ